jgi:hypothetical protein
VLLRKQLIAGAGAAAAVAALILTWLYARQLFAFVELPADDIPHRLAFAAEWLIIPGLTLLAGVMGASRRGFFADAIEGTRTPASWSLEINLRYNQNTVEQVLLAAIAWLGLAVALPHSSLIAIPASAVLFGLGRVTFWIGYVIHPLARAFGMALTAVPTLAAYVWLAARQLG